MAGSRRRSPGGGVAREALPASSEAVESSGPPSVRITRVRLGDTELAIVSAPLPGAAGLSQLTPAERDVFQRLLSGESREQIAMARCTSLRTIANQVASVFRKLGVCSRSELMLLYAGGNPEA